MLLIDKYLPYWPVLGGGLLFLLLGLWWCLAAGRARERAPKPISWVRNYRQSGFPFRPEVLGGARLPVWPLAAVGLASLVLGAFRLVNLSMSLLGEAWVYFHAPYGFFYLALSLVGAVSLYALIFFLHGSAYAAVLGALLFAASPARGHGAAGMLALTALLLLLWLRATKPGWPGELLYLAACLTMAPILALRPAAAWLLPLLPLTHWYKLRDQRRRSQLGLGGLCLCLGLALVVWALTFLGTVASRRFLQYGFSLQGIFSLTQPGRLVSASLELIRSVKRGLLARPMLGLAVDLLCDAPLLGFGFWGCWTALSEIRKRRSAPGVFVLVLVLGLVLPWLLGGSYALSLGLAAAAAFLLKNSDLGKRRVLGALLVSAGLLFSLLLQAAAWYLPLTKGLVDRLI